jgi:response regulator RpfG family c-di-GMP phosphodiesterase
MTAMLSTVLIIDDNTYNIDLLESALEDDYHIISACNGFEGLEIATSFLPDIILLDIEMPGLNGFDVCEQLKSNELTAKIPVIFISAQDNAMYETTGFEVGASDFISKPINLQITQSRVKLHLDLKKAQQERDAKIIELEKTISILESKLRRTGTPKYINQNIKKTDKTDPQETYILDEHWHDFCEYEEHLGAIINLLLLNNEWSEKAQAQLAKLFDQYAKVMRFYPLFHTLGYALSELAELFSSELLEPERKNFILILECLESLIFTLKFWRGQVNKKALVNPNAYDNSMISDIETIKLVLTNRLNTLNNDIEFF